VSPSLVHLGLVAVLYAAGVFLLLERSLTRVLLGVLMLGNATNLLLLASGGPAGGPPLVGRTAPEDMADPLPQAMVLTAIVITMGVAAFVLALIHRSWVLDADDEVNDDPEDLRIAVGPDELDVEHAVAPGEAPYDTGEDLGRGPDAPRPQPAGERT
jgi:multicomponent Na+:H+ antiporter subunit C